MKAQLERETIVQLSKDISVHVVPDLAREAKPAAP
jgi:hypothetical protein